jgi:hypothetical protein
MGKAKKWSKKGWKSQGVETEIEQNFSSLFEIDKKGKLSSRQKRRFLKPLPKKKIEPIRGYKRRKKEKDVPIEDPWASELTVKRKNKAPKADHIIEGNMPVPESGSSYNPSQEERGKLVEKALKKIEHEETAKARLRPIHVQKPLQDVPEDSQLAEKILKLQEVTSNRAAKTTINGKAALQEALEEAFLENQLDSDSDESDEEERTNPEELLEIQKMKKKKSERKTRRQRNARRRFQEQMTNRKIKLRKKEELKQLKSLPQIIEDFQQEKPKPPKEKKVDPHPQMGPLKFKESFPAVSLETELKGDLKSITPVGNLVQDSFRNIQRRNKLEVRKRISKKVGKKHPKFKVQYVIGARRGNEAEVVGRHYEY